MKPAARQLRIAAQVLAAALALQLPLFAGAASPSDETLAGKLISTGSDTLGSLTSVWAEMLMSRYPNLLMQVRATGSGAAPTALTEGTADVGPMSRPMSLPEQRAFERRFGYAPTAIPVAEDAIAVFVHRDNPLDSIRIAELDAIFSATRRCGRPEALRSWGQLGLASPWAGRPITRYGRSASSGTYSVFREQVLCGGDFVPPLNRMVGSSAVVRAVAMDLHGIGYVSAGYLNANVRRLQVLQADGVQRADLARRLYVYVNRAPGTPLDPVLAAFLNTVFSAAGQREVEKAGYLRLSRATLEQLLAELGLAPNA